MERIHTFIDLQNEYQLKGEQTMDTRFAGDVERDNTIAIKELSVNYRQDLPLVLKNVSFSIGKNQRVAIVGRTGCGKSSLMLSLLRLN